MSRTLADPIAAAVDVVRRQVDQGALSVGRDPADVALVAVSKGFPPEDIERALEVGLTEFGENRVQELVTKHRRLGPSVNWHFIGRLQRNKVRQVLSTRALIHSVDRLELASEINARAESPVRVLLEVNVTGEPNKAGVSPDALTKTVDAMMEMSNLEVVGLMTMARKAGNPELARPYFAELARLRSVLAEGYSDRIHHLSMGMSQDYRVAVEEGATIVRVGEAIFGRRTPPWTRQAEQPGESER